MNRVVVNITNEDGEVLERFIVHHDQEPTEANRNRLAFAIRDLIEHRFEVEEGS